MLPEMFTTGFTMEAESNAETMSGESVNWMAALAQRFNTTLCGSLIIKDGGNYYNRLIWMPPDGSVSHYDKRHLFRMANEHLHYSAGTTRPVFLLGDWRVTPLICYDLRFPVWSRGVNDFDLMVFVANWPAARQSAWQVLLPARAVENQCYVAGVNCTGTDGNAIPYKGDSGAYDYFGGTLAACGSEPGVVTITLDGSALSRYRDKFPAYRDADEFSID